MNKFTALSLVALLAISPTAARDKKMKSLPADYNYKAIAHYFSTYLNGDTVPFQAEYSLKTADIGTVARRVWNEWKEANAHFKEEKLPAAVPAITEDARYAWQLPATLEPNAVMPYYYGYKGETDGKYPFYIYMHGSGPKAMEWATGLKLAQNFDDGPSVYFVPQIPNEGQYYRWWQQSKQWTWEKLFRQIMAKDDVMDNNRIYMFGISEGGYGSQRLASFYADYLAGAGPMAGGEPLINAPAENLRNTAFSFHTGDKDAMFLRNELTSITGATLDSLQKRYPDGYVHNVVLEPNRGHSIDYSVTTPWLKQYVRKPWPKHVNWENFEMDGRYRSGFYNLYVNQRSNVDEQTRTYYRMDIDGNDIDISVDLVTYQVVKEDRRFGFGIGLLFEKKYTPATSGNFTIYLNEQLVDLNKKVNLTVNGKQVFSGKLTPGLENMVNSCARYFDPSRLYPAAITVDLSTMEARQ